VNPSAPPPAAKFWIIEHSTGIFVKWKKNFFFLKRPKFSWEGPYEEGFCFRNFEEAVRTLVAIRKTHPRAYLVEFKTRKSARML
jgi:hypothetical protein